MKLCKCGCEQEIIIKPHYKWRGIPDFIHGHNRNGVKRPPEFGALIKKKAIERHFTNNMRQEICKMYVDETMTASAIAAKLGTNKDVIVKRLKEEGIEIRKAGTYRKGFVVSAETREKLREAKNKYYQNPENSARHAESMKKRTKFGMSPEGFASWLKVMKGRKLSEEQKKKLCGRCGVLSATFGIPKTPEYKENMSEVIKKKWLDREYVLMMGAARSLKPNKPESSLIKVLDEMYPGEWKYTGDFSFTVNGKNPDFVNCNGQKKIIELFGDYWHRGENPQDRADIFSPFGYETLVIWEKELKNMENVRGKIQDFHEQRAA
jgi:transposase-like protein